MTCLSVSVSHCHMAPCLGITAFVVRHGLRTRCPLPPLGEQRHFTFTITSFLLPKGVMSFTFGRRPYDFLCHLPTCQRACRYRKANAGKHKYLLGISKSMLAPKPSGLLLCIPCIPSSSQASSLKLLIVYSPAILAMFTLACYGPFCTSHYYSPVPIPWYSPLAHTRPGHVQSGGHVQPTYFSRLLHMPLAVLPFMAIVKPSCLSHRGELMSSIYTHALRGWRQENYKSQIILGYKAS